MGVSACLAGVTVRYDGTHRAHANLDWIAEVAELVTFCPEASAGLGTPRPTMNLFMADNRIEALTTETPPRNVTRPVREASKRFFDAVGPLHGYLHKSRSPSCGVGSAPLFQAAEPITRLDVIVAPPPEQRHDGLFTQCLRQRLPTLPVMESDALEDPREVLRFILWIQSHARASIQQGRDSAETNTDTCFASAQAFSIWLQAQRAVMQQNTDLPTHLRKLGYHIPDWRGFEACTF